MVSTACSELNLNERTLSCADTPQAEFTTSFEVHDYIIQLNPGDQLSVKVSPIGDYLQTALELFEPAQDRIVFQGNLQKEASFETKILSGRGSYRIKVRNYGLYPDERINFKEKGRAGVYTMTLTCTLASN